MQSGSIISIKRQLSRAKTEYEEYNKDHNANGNLTTLLDKATESVSRIQNEVNEKDPDFRRKALRLKQTQEKIELLKIKINRGDHEAMSHLKRMSQHSFDAVTWVSKA